MAFAERQTISQRRAPVSLEMIVGLGALLTFGCTAASQGAASKGAAAPKGSAAGELVAPATAHVTLPQESRHVPTTEQAVLQALDDTATEIPPGASAPRFALADVTYPRSQAELDAMGGLALVFVTALSHESNELPIANVEVALGDKSEKLVQIAARKVLMPDGNAARTLGRYRSDGVYLMPVLVTRVHATLTVFLGGGALPMKVLEFPPPDSKTDLVSTLDLSAENRAPTRDAVCKLLKEELPVAAAGGLSCR